MQDFELVTGGRELSNFYEINEETNNMGADMQGPSLTPRHDNMVGWGEEDRATC